MPLTIVGGGDIRPYVRWKVSNDEWSYSSQDGMVDFEMKGQSIVVDMQSLTFGWLKIDQGREWQEWPSLWEPLPDPNPPTAVVKDWRHGFATDIFNPKLFGDESVREFSTNSVGALQFMQNLFNECERDHKDAFMAGKVPKVKITELKPVKRGRGTSRDIIFEIVEMVDRPDGFQRPTVAIEDPRRQAAPAPVMQSAPQPKAPEAPAPAQSDEEW